MDANAGQNAYFSLLRETAGQPVPTRAAGSKAAADNDLYYLCSEEETSYDKQFPYPLDNGDLRAARRACGNGRRRPGDAGRSRAETLGKKDPASLSGQDSGRLCRLDGRRIQPVR